jgi:hypothetical protein
VDFPLLRLSQEFNGLSSYHALVPNYASPSCACRMDWPRTELGPR